MDRLPTLKVTFDTPIKNWEISAFRGAMAKKVGLEHSWYHNHNNNDKPIDNKTSWEFSTEKYHYRYPLIQYKVDNRSGKTRPMMLCIGHCVEEAHRFFSQAEWDIILNGKQRHLSIYRMDVHEYSLEVAPGDFTYNVFNWLPLNAENYEKYKSKNGLIEQLTFLEHLLNQHLVSLFRSFDANTENALKATITAFRKEKWMAYKGNNKLLAFDISFKVNTFLPEYIGIGKGVSRGFGVVRKDRS
ncbi:MAG: CRISPR-associated endonuclease Cas6 [Saprospiraceae bacterium]